MPRHGQRYSNKGSNTILYYLKEQNRTISDLKRLLGIGRTKLEKKMKNPAKFEIDELIKIAGYFRTDFMEFVFSVYLNKPKLNTNDKLTLKDLVSKTTEFQKVAEKVV